MLNTSVFASAWRDAVPAPSTTIHRIRASIRSLAVSLLDLVKPCAPGKLLRCVYCHYVFDDQKHDLERLLRALQGQVEFVDTKTCLSILSGEAPLTGKLLHLSFDDGFRNVATNAAPILKRMGIPALMFVPTSIIGASLERVSDFCRERVHLKAPIEMMSWDDVKRLVDMGFDVGSHTRNHVRLSRLGRDFKALETEIIGSKEDLERELGTPCRYISWPYGTINDMSESAFACVRQAGYQACFSAVRGSIVPGRTSPFSIPRDHFEVQWPIGHVRYFALKQRSRSFPEPKQAALPAT